MHDERGAERPHVTNPRERVYDEQIAPLMEQILTICKANEIPFLCQAVLDRNPEEPEAGHLRCTSVIDNTDWDTPAMFRRAAKLLYRAEPAGFLAVTIHTGESK